MPSAELDVLESQILAALKAAQEHALLIDELVREFFIWKKSQIAAEPSEILDPPLTP